eukprot:2599235-Pleurochrysis_carterae.AAC.1
MREGAREQAWIGRENQPEHSMKTLLPLALVHPHRQTHVNFVDSLNNWPNWFQSVQCVGGGARAHR